MSYRTSPRCEVASSGCKLRCEPPQPAQQMWRPTPALPSALNPQAATSDDVGLLVAQHAAVKRVLLLSRGPGSLGCGLVWLAGADAAAVAAAVSCGGKGRECRAAPTKLGVPVALIRTHSAGPEQNRHQLKLSRASVLPPHAMMPSACVPAAGLAPPGWCFVSARVCEDPMRWVVCSVGTEQVRPRLTSRAPSLLR